MQQTATLGAPRHIFSALEVLRLQNPATKRLSELSGREQRLFFEWCDRRQITLLLDSIGGNCLPASFLEPMRRRKVSYGYRFERLKTELFQIAEAFEQSKLSFVMLKGLSHAPALTPNARLRAQGDIDLWLRGESVYQAREVLTKLGYVPLLDSKSRHLAPMGRPSKWRWRGDLFDPDMPVSVELHYELWSEKAEHVAAPGLEQFWDRKELRDFDGHKIHVLCDEDLVGFAALHLLLHVLHGELPLQRAWEIARFLHTRSCNERFWTSWRELHSPELRQLEILIFRLVTGWFGCANSPQLSAELERLPAGMESWLSQHALSPLKREWAPTKSELWLHLALIRSPSHKFRVLFRRLFPISLPGLNDRAQSQQSAISKLAVIFRNLPLLTSRLVRHSVTFVPTLLEGVRWYRLSRKL